MQVRNIPSNIFMRNCFNFKNLDRLRAPSISLVRGRYLLSNGCHRDAFQRIKAHVAKRCQLWSRSRSRAGNRHNCGIRRFVRLPVYHTHSLITHTLQSHNTTFTSLTVSKTQRSTARSNYHQFQRVRASVTRPEGCPDLIQPKLEGTNFIRLSDHFKIICFFELSLTSTWSPGLRMVDETSLRLH